MTTQEALKVLTAHNEWRRFKGGPDEIGPPMLSPTSVGVAIDVAIETLRQAVRHCPVTEGDDWPGHISPTVETREPT